MLGEFISRSPWSIQVVFWHARTVAGLGCRPVGGHLRLAVACWVLWPAVQLECGLLVGPLVPRQQAAWAGAAEHQELGISLGRLVDHGLSLS